jgi:hypothetical protein
MHLLDAAADGADWQEVCRIVLHIDPDHYPARARLAFDSHLAWAKWAARVGYHSCLNVVGLRRIAAVTDRMPRPARKAPVSSLRHHDRALFLGSV